MEIIENFKFPTQYWAVGSSYGGIEDQTVSFLNNNHWIEGWGLINDNRNKNVLDQVQVDDILVMKSSSTKGPGHSITFTKVKAIGVVLDKLNYYSFAVNWFDTKLFPKDFDGIRYGKTIEALKRDDLEKFVKEFLLDKKF